MATKRQKMYGGVRLMTLFGVLAEVFIWHPFTVYNGGLVDWIAGKITTDDDGDRIYVYRGVLAQSNRRLSETQI